MSSSRAARPTLSRNNMSSGSFIEDHQQYKAQASAPPNITLSNSIDGLLEAAPLTEPSSTALPLSPRKVHSPVSIPPSSPALVRDSGIVHSISHAECVLPASGERKLVATIFYNPPTLAARPRHADNISSSLSPLASTESLSALPAVSIPPGSAPTTSLSAYPLEPPPPDPEPLDRLYGSYVSQMCLTHFLSVVDSLLAHNPAEQRRLTSSHRCLSPDSDRARVVEVTFSPAPNPVYLPLPLLRKHEAWSLFEREWNVELVLQEAGVFRGRKRLAVFDMDSTLVAEETIEELARSLPAEAQEQIRRVTAQAMEGELDFEQSLRGRVKLLKGVPATTLEGLKGKMTIVPGARELCRALKRLGVTLVVASGGFYPLANWLRGELGMDHAFANHLVVDSETGAFTGELESGTPIVDAVFKRDVLRKFTKEMGIKREQSMAVGDGANDLLMLKDAGLGVAWRAKESVQMGAGVKLNLRGHGIETGEEGGSMKDLLFLLGLDQRDVDEVLRD